MDERLKLIWNAALNISKIAKQHVMVADFQKLTEKVKNPGEVINMYMGSILLHGLIQIYSRKCNFVFKDVESAVKKLNQEMSVGLEQKVNRIADKKSITMTRAQKDAVFKEVTKDLPETLSFISNFDDSIEQLRHDESVMGFTGESLLSGLNLHMLLEEEEEKSMSEIQIDALGLPPLPAEDLDIPDLPDLPDLQEEIMGIEESKEPENEELEHESVEESRQELKIKRKKRKAGIKMNEDEILKGGKSIHRKQPFLPSKVQRIADTFTALYDFFDVDSNKRMSFVEEVEKLREASIISHRTDLSAVQQRKTPRPSADLSSISPMGFEPGNMSDLDLPDLPMLDEIGSMPDLPSHTMEPQNEDPSYRPSPSVRIFSAVRDLHDAVDGFTRSFQNTLRNIRDSSNSIQDVSLVNDLLPKFATSVTSDRVRAGLAMQSLCMMMSTDESDSYKLESTDTGKDITIHFE
ncbi:hypothetical protein PCE1_000204 [Barthelona sp. PCE]